MSQNKQRSDAGLSFENARVIWTRDDMETYEGGVTIHANGWVEIHASAEYFPPHVVHEVSV